MFTSPRLNAGLLVGTKHVIARSQGLILPTALVKIEDAAGLAGKSR
jgi:hypothetical protein